MVNSVPSEKSSFVINLNSVKGNEDQMVSKDEVFDENTYPLLEGPTAQNSQNYIEHFDFSDRKTLLKLKNSIITKILIVDSFRSHII